MTETLNSFNGATFFRTWRAMSKRYPSLPRLCFNGATFFRTWRAYGRLLTCSAYSSFNGATFFRTWRGSTARIIPSPVLTSFNGATFFRTWRGVSSMSGRAWRISASMEPRSFERGESAFRRLQMLRKPRFNGATFFRTWRVHNGAKAIGISALLQWSHVLSNVERCVHVKTLNLK